MIFPCRVASRDGPSQPSFILRPASSSSLPPTWALSWPNAIGNTGNCPSWSTQSNLTIVVVGDFNDWMTPGSVQSVLARKLPGRTRHRTFPARLPLLKLDRIYSRPAEALVRSWVDPTARNISDHLPVIAEIRPYARQGERG